MKKYFIYAGSFILTFVILQLLSGMLLTMVYQPSVGWNNSSLIQSEITLVSSTVIMPIIIALISGGIALLATKLFNSNYKN